MHRWMLALALVVVAGPLSRVHAEALVIARDDGRSGSAIPPQRPALSESGQVAFVRGSGRDELFVGSAAGSAEQHVPLPSYLGLPATRYSGISSVDMNDQDVAFVAQDDAGLRGVYAKQLAGTIVVLHEGRLTDQDTRGPSPWHSVSLAANGRVAFTTLTEGRGKVYRGEMREFEVFMETLQLGASSPDRPVGLRLHLTDYLTVSASGTVALGANYVPEAGSRPDLNGIFLLRAPRETQQSVLTVLDQRPIADQPDVAINGHDQTVYMRRTGIFRGDARPYGSAREELPLLDDRGDFAAFRLAGDPQAPVMTPLGSGLRINDGGLIAFEAQRRDGAAGVFVLRPDGSAEPVLVQGEHLEGQRVSEVVLGDLNNADQLALFVTVETADGGREHWIVRAHGRIGG